MQSSDKVSLQVPEGENRAYCYPVQGRNTFNAISTHLTYRFYDDYKYFITSIALDTHQYDLKYSHYCYPAKQRMTLLSSLSLSHTRRLASLQQLKPTGTTLKLYRDYFYKLKAPICSSAL